MKKIFAQIYKIPVRYWLTGILIFSFLLKLLCWYITPTVSRDGCLYIRLAQVWYNSNRFQGVLDAFPAMWLPPLPLYLMKCLMALGLSAEYAGVWLNLISGTFTPLLAYGIAWEITQKRNIALCSALLAAVNPSLNALSVEIQRDAIYLFFIGVVLWLLTAGIRRQKWQYWLIGGIVCGCAMLTRFETLEFSVLVPMTVFLLCIGKHCLWKKGICYVAFFFSGFIGCIFALLFQMQVHDYFLPSYEKYYQGKYAGVIRSFSTNVKGPRK